MLYYLPGERAEAMDPRRVRELGLGYLLDGPDCDVACRGVLAHGPDGGAGTVVSAMPAGRPEVGYYPNRQEWHEARVGAGEGRPVWIGWPKGQPPGPEDLARREMMGGHAVTLSDGRRWLVPVARLVTGDSPLPRRLVRGDDGQWTPGDVSGPLAGLFAAACRWWEALTSYAEAAFAGGPGAPEGTDPGSPGGGGETMTAITLQDECETAVMALAVNYRLSAVEVNLLGLLDERTEAEVLMALCDWPAVLEMSKKAASAGPGSPPGGTDGSGPDTSRPSAS